MLHCFSEQAKQKFRAFCIWGVILIMYSKEDGVPSRRIEIETASKSFWEVEILEISGSCKMTWWIKNSPALQETRETQVRCLGQEDPLEEGMATHSSILAWEIPWVEEPGGLPSLGSQRVGCDWASKHTHAHKTWPANSRVSKRENAFQIPLGTKCILEASSKGSGNSV